MRSVGCCEDGAITECVHFFECKCEDLHVDKSACVKSMCECVSVSMCQCINGSVCSCVNKNLIDRQIDSDGMYGL